jgi:hypothetical protein
MTTDRTDRYSRRALLKGLGLGIGMLPLLNADKGTVRAAGVAKRFIAVTWTGGVVPDAFYPPAGPLTGTLPPILQPLDAWKSKILAMRGAGSGVHQGGIDCQVMVDAGQPYSGARSYPSLLTGSVGGTTPSIDTLIANRLESQGFASPQLNLRCGASVDSTSWRAGQVKSSAEADPYRVYARLFAGVDSTPGATPAVDPLLARRKSVMDFCLDDLTNFAKRLGTEDRVKIDAHLASIRNIETQLTAVTAAPPAVAGCQPPANSPTGLDWTLRTNYPDHVRLMMDIIAASVRCDLARSITLELTSNDGLGLTFPWLGILTPDYSAIGHAGVADYPQKTLIDTWFYTQVAGLIGQLAANVEGASTSLDCSVVLVCNAMNEGNAEGVEGLPYVIIGSGGGFFKQGTCVQFPVNAPNNQLLASVCHAMDLPVTSVGTTYTGDLDATLKA